MATDRETHDRDQPPTHVAAPVPVSRDEPGPYQRIVIDAAKGAGVVAPGVTADGARRAVQHTAAKTMTTVGAQGAATPFAPRDDASTHRQPSRGRTEPVGGV
ncbi:MAG: hypothetical protein AAGE90_14760 [Pseudomonadota bacterium]